MVKANTFKIAALKLNHSLEDLREGLSPMSSRSFVNDHIDHGKFNCSFTY